MARRKRRRAPQLQDELDDLVRGICGGFLFGIPLLYTMEVWWIGSYATPPILLLILFFTLLIVYLLSRTEGFRKNKATTETEVLSDAIEAVAIGLVCTATMLITLQQITWETHLDEALGKIIVESSPFSLGVALANQFLQSAEENPSAASGGENAPSKPDSSLNETLADIGATLVGSIVIASSIAPTDEVPMLVSAVRGSWLLLVVILSLLLSYGIVFQADFAHQVKRRKQRGWFQSPLSETLVSYLIALLMSALMLAFFQRIGLDTPWELVLRNTIILGLPAAIGGAAGRLVI